MLFFSNMKKCLIVYSLLIGSLLGKAQSDTDSLKSLLFERDLPDTVNAKIIFDLGVSYRHTDRDSSMHYANKGLSFSLEKKLTRYTADFHLLKSILFYSTNQLDSIIFHAQKSLTISSENDYLRNHIRSLNMLGLAADRRGNYSKALEYYLEAIVPAESYNDKRLLSSLNYNIGLVYDAQGLKLEALDYFHKAYDINEEFVHDDYSKLNFLNGIAPTYAELENYDSANYYYGKALDLAEQLNDTYNLASLYQGMGSMALDRGQLDKAIDFYRKSEKLNLENNDLWLLSYNYQGMSSYYDHLESVTGDKANLRKSLEYGEKLLEIAKILDAEDRILEGYKRIFDASYELGNYENAIEYHIKYVNLKDSLFDARKSDQILSLKEQYEADKREQEIASQKEKIKLSDAQLAKEATLRNALIGGVILVLIISGLIYRNQRLKAKALNEKEALLKEIHHRVKNNLQVISSLLNMQSRGTEDTGMKEAIREGQARVKAMSLIHQKLYQNENISEIDFEDYSQQLISQLDAVYKKAEKQIKHIIDVKGISLDIDTAVPLGLILNELISNAYKYAFDGVNEGELRISLERKDEKHLQLEVADNGKGLPVDFNIDTAKSLGLKLVNILTKQLKGTLQIEQGTGTRFLIQFSEINPKVA